MGKILCETTTTTATRVSPAPSTWRDPPPSTTTTAPATVSSNVTSWDDVTGLEAQQKSSLSRLGTKGVLWKHPQPQPQPQEDMEMEMDLPETQVLLLCHGGEVESDGNCLFTAAERVLGEGGLRRTAVRRFQQDYGDAGEQEREEVDRIIRNMYSPDLNIGWGVHVVQDLKLLLTKSQRPSIQDEILQLVHLGMQRESAAETIYKERCIAVDDGPSWAKYMSISGSPDDEYDIITLQYTEEGLLTVDENTQGRAAAFGDDIAIQCLATHFHREIFVVQAHGSDAMVDEDNCVFFLPHRPRGQINGLPVFLFMKGTAWCGAGGDHYEPLIAHPSSLVSQEKVGFVL